MRGLIRTIDAAREQKVADGRLDGNCIAAKQFNCSYLYVNKLRSAPARRRDGRLPLAKSLTEINDINSIRRGVGCELI